MIKLIATDLDGTLLDGNQNLPKGIFDVVTELTRHGVIFAPASGRQYANLKKLFAPVADEVLFICENGALVVYRGKTLYLDPIPNEEIPHTLEEIRAVPRLFPMLCGVKNAYVENGENPFYDCAVAAYTNCVKVDRLDDVVGREPVCKIAVFDELGAAENGMKKLPARLSSLRTAISGKHWCDISAPHVDKGAAIRFLRKTFALEKEECAAFGDHMNDYEMLAECGHSYVTENAYPPLKALVKNVVPSNLDGGVMQKLTEFLSRIKENI